MAFRLLDHTWAERGAKRKNFGQVRPDDVTCSVLVRTGWVALPTDLPAARRFVHPFRNISGSLENGIDASLHFTSIDTAVACFARSLFWFTFVLTIDREGLSRFGSCVGVVCFVFVFRQWSCSVVVVLDVDQSRL